MTAITRPSPTAAPDLAKRATPQKVLQQFATNTQSSQQGILCTKVTSHKNIKNPDLNNANDHNSSKRIFPDVTPMGHAPHGCRPDVSDVHVKAKP
jgi:hypothetical protein